MSQQKAKEHVSLPADPEDLARAIVERYNQDDLGRIAAIIQESLPTLGDVLKAINANAVEPPTPKPETFSEQQLEIVRRIHRRTDTSLWDTPYYKKAMRRAVNEASEMDLLLSAYPKWEIEHFVTGEVTPAKRASVSRALKRLYDRGIVSVRYGTNSRKVRHVSLTTQGERLAERLISG